MTSRTFQLVIVGAILLVACSAASAFRVNHWRDIAEAYRDQAAQHAEKVESLEEVVDSAVALAQSAEVRAELQRQQDSARIRELEERTERAIVYADSVEAKLRAEIDPYLLEDFDSVIAAKDSVIANKDTIIAMERRGREAAERRVALWKGVSAAKDSVVAEQALQIASLQASVDAALEASGGTSFTTLGIGAGIGALTVCLAAGCGN